MEDNVTRTTRSSQEPSDGGGAQVTALPSMVCELGY